MATEREGREGEREREREREREMREGGSGREGGAGGREGGRRLVNSWRGLSLTCLARVTALAADTWYRFLLAMEHDPDTHS